MNLAKQQAESSIYRNESALRSNASPLNKLCVFSSARLLDRAGNGGAVDLMLKTGCANFSRMPMPIPKKTSKGNQTVYQPALTCIIMHTLMIIDWPLSNHS